MNVKVDQYLAKQKRWQEELSLLREILKDIKELDEDFKWMHPCYTLMGKNIAVIQEFKEYCAVMFFKGALMKDPNSRLIQMTENVQAARQIRFTNIGQIKKDKLIIKAYVKNAIEIEKSGKKVPLRKASDLPMPEEFQKVLNENSRIETAFNALTPGRQKGYLFYFSQAKQSKTRESRIEKYIPKILEGKGLND